MDNITHIVKVVLEENADCDLSQPAVRTFVAQRVAHRLLKGSLSQLASLLGGTIGADEDGSAVIYTDILFGRESFNK